MFERYRIKSYLKQYKGKVGIEDLIILRDLYERSIKHIPNNNREYYYMWIDEISNRINYLMKKQN